MDEKGVTLYVECPRRVTDFALSLPAPSARLSSTRLDE